MNRKQKIVLWTGIVVIVLMGLFPPVLLEGSPDGAYSNDHKDYIFITDPSNTHILWSNLFLQWILVSVVTGCLMYVLRDSKFPQNSSGTEE